MSLENQIKITVVTPSVRPEMLAVISKCLRRQTEKSFEWLVGSPERMADAVNSLLSVIDQKYTFTPEPPKKPGDYYSLCKCWNKLFSKAKGELIVSIQDGIWFEADMLERFYAHYKANPKGLVTAIGHHYDQLDDYGKPQNLVWSDPRSRLDLGSFYEVPPSEMEMSVCSVPKQALVDCGGIDEVYDKGAAVGEKEMCWRLDKLGYKFYIDQTLEYRAIQHPRLSENWDAKYKIASELFIDHMVQMKHGKRRLNANCLDY